MKRKLIFAAGTLALALFQWACSGKPETPKDKPTDIVVNPNYVEPTTPPPARPTIHDFRSYELNFNFLKLPWETSGEALPLSQRNRLPNSYISDLEQYEEMYSIGKFEAAGNFVLVLYGETKNQQSRDYLIHTFSKEGNPLDTLFLAGTMGERLQSASINEAGCITRTQAPLNKALPAKTFGQFDASGHFAEQNEACEVAK